MSKSSTTRSNGHAAANGKPNGKPAAAGKDVASAERGRPTGTGRAASVDAKGASVASAAVSSAAAGADHGAYAEAARAPNGKIEKRDKSHSKKHHSDAPRDRAPVPPGARPLPKNGEDFIDALHAGADFAHIGVKLLNSKDEKVVKAVWERLLDIKYGEDTERDETPQIIVGRARRHED